MSSRCRLLAHLRSRQIASGIPLTAAKRTCRDGARTADFDPSQTLANAPHPVRSLSRGLGDVGNASRLLESRSISQFLCQKMPNLLRRVASSDRVVLLPMTKDARSRLEIRDIEGVVRARIDNQRHRAFSSFPLCYHRSASRSWRPIIQFTNQNERRHGEVTIVQAVGIERDRRFELPIGLPLK